MSYPLDVDAQSLALDGLLGDNHASTIPDTLELAIWHGDPRDIDSAELELVGGYERVLINNDSATWPDAIDGLKISNPIDLSDPTDDWSDTGTHWVTLDPADSTTIWFFGLLQTPLDVDGTETLLQVSPALYWNTAGQ